MKNKIKNIFDGFIMALILLVSAICFVEGIITLSFPLLLLPLPFMVVSADRLIGDIEGNFIKKSIFSVSRNGFIAQDTLRNPLYLFKKFKIKDKQTFLMNEEFKMFKQLIKRDAKGKEKPYHTISQALTVKLLKSLKKKDILKI